MLILKTWSTPQVILIIINACFCSISPPKDYPKNGY
ncbi:MAG: hypothetical protein ACJA0I_000739, partial [Gammaproteobacteria bacterium]